MTVTGWGRSTNDEYTNRFNLANYNVPTTLLQKLDIPLVSEIECLKVKPYRERLQMDFHLQFCAGGEEGKNSFLFGRNFLTSTSLLKMKLCPIVTLIYIWLGCVGLYSDVSKV